MEGICPAGDLVEEVPHGRGRRLCQLDLHKVCAVQDDRLVSGEEVDVPHGLLCGDPLELKVARDAAVVEEEEQLESFVCMEESHCGEDGPLPAELLKDEMVLLREKLEQSF